MKYELVYTRRAEKDILKLEESARKRIGKAILYYKEDPLRHAEKLTDSKLGTYRFRIGDYRAVFDIEGNEIVVLRVGHRKEIYRRR
ncbi:MAG: type II toxin-antitoxin system RelE/ParE family toxin [Thermodesulfovibrionales bacterium]|nr:type II toxin-antitoxin system RelE/ParE family toxin [Thermodesulfovibrionales bacterium]